MADIEMNYPIVLMSEEVKDLFRANPWDLYPPFLEKVVRGLGVLLAKGEMFWVTQGMRTFAEQNKLYSYGRLDTSRNKVTNAKGGFSAHNYGIAVDCVRDENLDKPGLQPDWKSRGYKVYADAMVEQGLEAGFYWKSFFDGPHVQLPLRKYGLDTKILRRIYKEGGKYAVWSRLDKETW